MSIELETQPKKISQYTDVEFMAAFWKYFGAKRGIEILGWCSVAAATAFNDSPSVLRQKLEERGLSKSALYRALDDLRSLQEHIEGQPLPRRDSSYALSLLKRISASTCL